MYLDDSCHVRRVQTKQNRTEDAVLGTPQVTNDVSDIFAFNGDGLRPLAAEGDDSR